MSDQTNAVKGDIDTINHFVNIFLNILSFTIIYLVVMSNFINIYIPPTPSHPSPYCYEIPSVQSGLSLTVNSRFIVQIDSEVST